jgi:hypothetical protein
VVGEPNELSYDETLRLTVPTSRVAADTVEGEAVIINLDTGAYYTTDGAGCDAWQLLASGRTLGEVVAALEQRYDAEAGAVEGYVQVLVETILAEGLMLIVDPDDPAPIDEQTEVPAVETKEPFEPAEFVSYHDMKSLLLLDPVHDVDAEGWPRAAAGG